MLRLVIVALMRPCNLRKLQILSTFLEVVFFSLALAVGVSPRLNPVSPGVGKQALTRVGKGLPFVP